VTDSIYNGWTIRLADKAAIAVRALDKKRFGLARKRGESAEDLMDRMRKLIDSTENAFMANPFLNREPIRS